MKITDNKTSRTESLDEVQQTLYAKRQKIYPREVHGVFARLRVLSSFILLGIYYALPWIQWDNRQAVLFDLPTRQFYIFEIVFWPQDLIYLAFLLIIAGLSLFFFTTLAGRLWCGFACPQTVWTDVFLWMERLVEGDRPNQIKLDKSPLSFHKFGIKFSKHTLWIVFSLFTGFTFVGYFTSIRELSVSITTFDLGEWEIFWLFFYAFATYGNAGWMREQVCIYMCPYARFQSAMFDKNTLIIAYDEQRGEPRGQRKRGSDYRSKGLGDCINCTMCIQVCPTNIDIRNGLQYQCISCSACIDICNEIMDKMGYNRGLIRYTTENRLNGKQTQVFRPRVFVYGGILLALLMGTLYSISNRIDIQLDVIRDRNSLFRETDQGMIENIYILKVMNMDQVPHVYNLAVSGIKDLELKKDVEGIQVEAGKVLAVAVRLVANQINLDKRSTSVTFTLTDSENTAVTISEEGRFLGPSTTH